MDTAPCLLLVKKKSYFHNVDMEFNSPYCTTIIVMINQHSEVFESERAFCDQAILRLNDIISHAVIVRGVTGTVQNVDPQTGPSPLSRKKEINI